MSVVDSKLIGDAWPQAHPGADPVLYGNVSLSPEGAFEARSLQTFALTYTAGRFGLDDTGSIKIVHRYSNDWGWLQTEDPTGVNYVSAQASNGSRLQLIYENGGEQRPWYRSLTIVVRGDGLYEGDTITVLFGDRSGGSPGLKLQTFCESGFVFKVLADVCATGHYMPVPDMPSIAIVPGPPASWKAVLPSLRRPGETFRLGIKAEDLWGNPTGQAQARLRLESQPAGQRVAGNPRLWPRSARLCDRRAERRGRRYRCASACSTTWVNCSPNPARCCCVAAIKRVSGATCTDKAANRWASIPRASISSLRATSPSSTRPATRPTTSRSTTPSGSRSTTCRPSFTKIIAFDLPRLRMVRQHRGRR